jgi:hypothetical protein
MIRLPKSKRAPFSRPAASRALASLAIAGLAVALVAPFAPALAKQAEMTATVVKELIACRSVAADAERLACYDKAVSALDQAQKSGAVVVVDREQIKEAKKDAFGFNLPSFGKLFDRNGEKTEQVNEIELVVDHAFKNGNGKWVIVMEGGQTWRQIDTNELTRIPHKGSKAVVKRGAIGSFSIKVDGDLSFKAHRDE